MRAVLVDPSTRSLRYELVDDPVPAEGQLLVRVRAAALNRADIGVRTGSSPVRPDGTPVEPFVAGMELAGEVLDVGTGVTGWKPCDRVMGLGSGYAELAVLDAALAMRIPTEL